MTTGWNSSVTISKFDPDLGALSSVSIRLIASTTGEARFESLDAKPANISLTFAADVSLSRPGGVSEIASATPSQQIATSSTAYDGTVDFGGSSGATFSGIDETAIEISALVSSADLALFTGTGGSNPPGSIVLPLRANGASTGSGAGNLILQFANEAAADVEVCYIYEPDCNGNGISDEFEILDGSALDCNKNDIPDTCDIQNGSRDINGDGIPDECGAGSSICNGDGGDGQGCTDCPCLNNVALGSIGGCLNSAGTSARLSAIGSPSVSLPQDSATDLRLALHGIPPHTFSILSSGDGIAPGNPANPCFGVNSGSPAAVFDGLRCAIGNTRRHGGRGADANGDVGETNSPWGGEGNPVAGISQTGGTFVPGQTRFFQAIYRDDPLAACMRGLNTSQAIRITFTP